MLNDFLNNEYEKTRDYLTFIHQDRAKYVTVFVSLQVGSGYAFFKAIDSCNWAIAISIAIFSGFFNIFFLRWFMVHRVKALKYVEKLNAIRNELFNRSGEDERIKELILTPSQKAPDWPPYSREYEFYRVLVLLIALNFGAAIFLLFSHFPHKNSWAEYLIIILSLFFGLFALFRLDKFIESFLKRKRRR